jgi:hypothetical protein
MDSCSELFKTMKIFLISSFRRVLNVACNVLGCSQRVVFSPLLQTLLHGQKDRIFSAGI